MEDLRRERKEREYVVTFICATWYSEYMNDEEEIVNFIVNAVDPAEALRIAQTSFLYDEKATYNHNDIIDVKIRLSLDELKKWEEKEKRLLKK